MSGKDPGADASPPEVYKDVAIHSVAKDSHFFVFVSKKNKSICNIRVEILTNCFKTNDIVNFEQLAPVSSTLIYLQPTVQSYNSLSQTSKNSPTWHMNAHF